MKFLHVAQRVFCEPWLIRPQEHAVIADIVERHIAGDGGDDLMGSIFPEPPGMSIEGATAIVPVHGVIGRGFSQFEKSCGACDTDDVAAMLEQATEASEINKIILDVDSPGGAVNGTPELADVIAGCAQKKNVVAYTGGLMCSAAYWLAAQASEIYASRSATIGSIGVYMPIVDQTRAYENAGYKVELVKSGKYKGAGYPGTRMTDEQRELLQNEVDEIHADFKRSVGHRGIADEDMEGQSFSAMQALDKYLIDGIKPNLRALLG
jgi:signal peptide peptidase SppA